MPWRETLCPRLTDELARALRALDAHQAAQAQELRIYAGGGAVLIVNGQSRRIDVRADACGMQELLSCLSGHALYSCEAQMAKGYIPLPGGHRAGVCGRMTQEDGAWRMADVTSVCVRIARHIPGASRGIRRHLLTPDGRVRRVLLLGAPGCGKTTVLRDAAVWLADEMDRRVAAADEREELFPEGMRGICARIDVLAGMDKAQAFALLLRSMAPQAIVTDEIGSEADAQALADAARCGAGVIATAHADGMAELMCRPVLRALLEGRTFERYIHLGGHGAMLHVFDENGQEITKSGGEGEEYGELGCGGDGDDRHQRRGLFAV